MTPERAHTHIDRGTALAANRWFERAWQLFNGQTFSLEVAETKWDWITAPSPEIALTLNGAAMGLMDFPSLEISEHADAFGAGIRIVRANEQIRVTTDTTVLHDFPAYVRKHSIMNLTSEEVSIEHFALDALTLNHEGIVAATDDFSSAQPALRLEESIATVGIEYHEGCMLLGTTEPANYDCFDATPGELRVTCAHPVVSPPYESVDAPVLFGIVYQGPMANASRKVLGEVLLLLREMMKRDDEDA